MSFYPYKKLVSLQLTMASIWLLFEENAEENERSRRRRYMRQQFNVRSLPDSEFLLNYRVTRTLFESLCEDLIPIMPHPVRRSGIDPRLKVLTALNFYARGSYQGAVGLSSDVPMAQQTVSRCIRDITNALNSPCILEKFIKFPQNVSERNVLKRQFYDSFGIPGVIGCIDCTHVAIVRPSENEERYFNRKHYHSLNVQVICDAQFQILNVDASYGGATHDSFIWSHHEINSHLEMIQDETVYLLGDSGYPQRQHMMTPIENTLEDSPEARYNRLQKRTRSIIERTFGILKGRWRCLLAARELHYTPERAGKIVIACSVLHNLCNRAGVDAPPLTAEDLDEERSRQAANIVPPHQALQQGVRARNRLVQLLENGNETL